MWVDNFEWLHVILIHNFKGDTPSHENKDSKTRLYNRKHIVENWAMVAMKNLLLNNNLYKSAG